MKILIVNKFLYTVGGSETYCFALDGVLKKNGHEVIWFGMKNEKNVIKTDEKYLVNFIDYKTKNIFKKIIYAFKYLYSFEAKRKIAKLLDKEKPDVVHLNLVHHQITLSIIKEIKKRNIPIVWTLHDLIGICPNYLMLNHGVICEKCINKEYKNCYKSSCVKNSKLKSFLAYLEAKNYQRMNSYSYVSTYITPSNFYKEKYECANFTNSKIIHIPNLLPLETVYSCTNEREDYILYFGRLSKEKGIATLIRAMAHSPHKLYIVGRGELQDELENLVKELNLNEYVVFLGFKSGKELKTIISRSKCVVLPSEWYENGPYSVMEAMALGTPLIVSNVGGLPEIVINKKNGYLFNMGDSIDLSQKIQEIFELNDEEYENMCNFSMELSKEKFDADEYYNKIIGIYNEIIEEVKHV